MNILLLGSGGRESALAWKISQSPECSNLIIAPGNGGTEQYGRNLAIKPTDFQAVLSAIRDNAIDMVVVGNEDPLVAGLTDFLKVEAPDVLVVGPSKEGARLEGSKDFAKQFMESEGIPTARYRSFTADTLEEGKQFLATLNPPYVLKADGLAAGKGVLILDSLEEAQKELGEMLGGMFGASSATVVIEEFLSGIECSVFVLTDGNGGYRILPVAKDYKRILEGDKGPNTGGMGAVSPVPFADEEFMKKVEQRIVRPTIDGLRRRNIDYKGFIFLGLINVGGEPMVIEYNVRMGDPETEVVMLRIASDLVPLLKAAAAGNLGELPLEHDPRAAATVMLVSGGYPGSYPKGKEITGPVFSAGQQQKSHDCAASDASGVETVVFHAGTTKTDEGKLVTSGGRVMAISSYGKDLPEALSRSYRLQESINFDGKTFRSDIGNEFI